MSPAGSNHRLCVGAHGLVLGLLVIVIFPFFWLLQMSVKPDKMILASPVSLMFRPILDHYVALWGTAFRGSFINSSVVAISSALLSLALGVPAAYALSRGRFGWEHHAALWVLASRMAPPIAFTLPFFLLYRYLGLLDTRAGLVIIYLTFNLSLVVWMMRAFFDGTPQSLEEAAWIDGASLWQGFLRIALPLAGPGLAATAIFCFLFSWNDFFFALILTRTRAMTSPVAVVNFMNYEGWEWGKIAAGATLVMLPVVLFSLLVRKYLVRGLTAGALKG